MFAGVGGVPCHESFSFFFELAIIEVPALAIKKYYFFGFDYVPDSADVDFSVGSFFCVLEFCDFHDYKMWALSPAITNLQ